MKHFKVTGTEPEEEDNVYQESINLDDIHRKLDPTGESRVVTADINRLNTLNVGEFVEIAGIIFTRLD
jgi:hypothetical protein